MYFVCEDLVFLDLHIILKFWFQAISCRFRPKCYYQNWPYVLWDHITFSEDKRISVEKRYPEMRRVGFPLSKFIQPLCTFHEVRCHLPSRSQFCCLSGFWGFLLLWMPPGLLMIWLLGIFTARYAHWTHAFIKTKSLYLKGYLVYIWDVCCLKCSGGAPPWNYKQK